MISNPIIYNTPVSLIEGMALGMCVITTKVGGVSFLVNDSECALIEAENEAALLAAIEKLLVDSNYAGKLSVNGRLKAEQFGWINIKKIMEWGVVLVICRFW